MITYQRNYETQVKAMHAAEELDTAAAQLLRVA
jgi:flagellar basal body rod protein FlgF